MSLVFVTACSADYPRAWIFPTLERLVPFGRVVALLDPADRRYLPTTVERIPYQADGCRYQDGRFLAAVLGVQDDDVVVLLDADAVIQRGLTEEELWLLRVKDVVVMGYNLRPGEQGHEEYRLLRPRKPLEEEASVLRMPESTLRLAWIYNTGLLAATAATWKMLLDLYPHHAAVHCPAVFTLHSWPQYLVCCTLYHYGIPVRELGYETHSHGHHPLTARHSIRGRQLYYDGQLVFYAHFVQGVTH